MNRYKNKNNFLNIYIINIYNSCYLLINNCNFIFMLFFFNQTTSTMIYTLSLHDALPISLAHLIQGAGHVGIEQHAVDVPGLLQALLAEIDDRSEEHTSELQSRFDLVCRLLLEKKKIKNRY